MIFLEGNIRFALTAINPLMSLNTWNSKCIFFLYFVAIFNDVLLYRNTLYCETILMGQLSKSIPTPVAKMQTMHTQFAI